MKAMDIEDRLRSIAEQLRPTDRVVMYNKPFDRGKLPSRPPKQRSGMKPDGIWYACGREWIDFAVHDYKAAMGGYVYSLSIDMRRVLRLTTPDDILAFTQGYVDRSMRPGTGYIEWQEVAKEYTGIEICPYQWDLRMSSRTNWYYPWDVASGCIWDASIIKSVDVIMAD